MGKLGRLKTVCSGRCVPSGIVCMLLMHTLEFRWRRSITRLLEGQTGWTSSLSCE